MNRTVKIGKKYSKQSSASEEKKYFKIFFIEKKFGTLSSKKYREQLSLITILFYRMRVDFSPFSFINFISFSSRAHYRG